MKMNFLKSIVVLAITTASFTSCVKEDDFDIPTLKEVVFYEGFEDATAGSGSTEIPVTLEGWVNSNLGTGTRLWIVKQFNNNKFAEFSSFYSVAPATDESWLITPEIELKDASYALSFATQVRFFTNNNLEVFISQNFDGDATNIAAANWIALNPIISGQANNNSNVFLSSGEVNLTQYKNSKVRIGFKYVGSKQAGTTSTFQLDNIKVFEN